MEPSPFRHLFDRRDVAAFDAVERLRRGLDALLASLLVFGLTPWLDWIAALPRFGELVAADRSLLVNVVTPRGGLLALGVEGAPLILGQVAGALLGLGVVILAFRRPTDPPTRLAALIGAALLCSPYAMNYELALLAPAAAAAVARLQAPDWLVALLAFMLLSLALPGLLTLIGLLICALQPWRLLSQRPGRASWAARYWQDYCTPLGSRA